MACGIKSGINLKIKTPKPDYKSYDFGVLFFVHSFGYAAHKNPPRNILGKIYSLEDNFILYYLIALVRACVVSRGDLNARNCGFEDLDPCAIA